MWTRQLSLASSSLTSFSFWGCQWWLQPSTDLQCFLSGKIWFNVLCTWSVIRSVQNGSDAHSLHSQTFYCHSHSWSAGNTGAVPKQYLNRQNRIFHGKIRHSLCMWGEISKYSLVSVSFLKSLKHLVNNLFPQLQNYDSEATPYRSFPAGFAEQKANGNQKLHEKHIFKNGVLTSLSLTITSANKNILYNTGHRLGKIFWSGKWQLMGWGSQSQLKYYGQSGNKTSDYKHGWSRKETCI